MPPALSQAIVAGCFALIGALMGALLSPTITFLLNDKTRKIDLYKSVYPIRVEAARSFMEQAAKLFEKVHQSECGSKVLPREVEKTEWDSLSDEVKKLESLAWSSEWVLGIEVKNATTDFINACHSKIVPPRNADRCEFLVQEYLPAYRTLAETVRKQIHLPELQEAVKPKTKEDNPLSHQREG